MKTLTLAIILAFATPAMGASSTTWKYDKKTKTYRVTKKKLKSTLELIESLKSKPQRTHIIRRKK